MDDGINPERVAVQREAGSRADMLALVGIALVVAVIHLLTNNRYGFHRDELQFLSDARHLDWGFVAYPPFTPFVERIGLEIFGVSMVGLRLFSVIAQALAIVVTGLMARELGGGRLAQVTAALVVATSGLPVFEGTEFQYSTFDYLWWVLIAYFVIRLLKTEDPRWWMAIGAAIGLGLLTKYTICFFIAGILGGMLLTSARRYFLSGWFWGGVGVALLIFLPNFCVAGAAWVYLGAFLAAHPCAGCGRGAGEWILAGSVHHLHEYVCCAVVDCGAVIYFLRDRRYRMLGWMYVIPLRCFSSGRGEGIIVAAAYPMLFAMGAVAGRALGCGRCGGAGGLVVEGVFFTGSGGVGGVCLCADCAAGFEWAAEGVCAEEQWRSAGGDWVG